jgi:hypothetical protein
MNALHSSFNFEAVHARTDKLRNVLDHAQVFGAHGECIVILIEQWKLFDTHLLPMILLRCKQIIFPTTGLGAASSIGIPVCKVI